MVGSRQDPGACLIAVHGWRRRRLRDLGEIRDPRARLRRAHRANEGEDRRKGGYLSKGPAGCDAGYDDLSTRRRGVEGSASARRPNNHTPTSRIGNSAVDLPFSEPPHPTSEEAEQAERRPIYLALW